MTDELSRREQRYRDEKLASEVEERVLSRTTKFLEYSRWRMRFAPYLAYAALLVAVVTLAMAYLQNKERGDQLNQLRIQLDDLESRSNETRIQLNDLEAKLNETTIKLDNLESRFNNLK